MQLVCPHCHQQLHFSGRSPAFCAYCGKPLPPASEASTVAHDGFDSDAEGDDPSEIGGYRLLRLLGEGGMGRVYEAEDVAAGRRVAVKLISAEYAASPAAVERFRREGRLASGVSHPRCVFVLAADEAGGRPYIVMELMPGATLQDLVDREGPLPVDQAILKILDVIEGLREAHRLGVVHRDVKPSNCFVDAEGRVKIGDFGLSKSLVGSDALTRTGTFIGTPLFASPEQIKGEIVGPPSDVYSTAATLYCLLTGKAPFQGGDSAATLARIVSDPAPPMRSLRPDVPQALDRAVLRGLERDPAKRWRDLDEFQVALLPFVPGRLSIGGLGIRFGAYLIDYGVLMLATTPIALAVAVLNHGGSLFAQDPRPDRLLYQMLTSSVVWIAYFGGCEALWGCTLGKRWLGLRVCQVRGGERPGIVAAVLRAALFFLLLNLGTLAFAVEILAGVVDPSNRSTDNQLRVACVVAATIYPLTGLGIVVALCTMRARNGYRGLHEFLSATRVVRLPERIRRRAALAPHLHLETMPAEGLPPRIGPFDVEGVLQGSGRGRLLLAHDPSLGRRVWVWLRPAADPAPSPVRRDLSRATRLRWVAGGREDRAHPEGVATEGSVAGLIGEPAGLFHRDQPRGSLAGQEWDAFLAPDGAPLMAVAEADRMSWGETRQMLGQLADELIASEGDGTRPATLGLAQIWVRPDAQILLLDMSMSKAEAHDAAPLSLLASAALSALGASPPRGRGRSTGLGVPLPRHAVEVLGRLLGAGKPYADVKEFRAALAAVADKPAETTRPRRLAHLAVLAAFLSIGLCSGLLPQAFVRPIQAAGSILRIRQDEVLRDRMKEVAAQDAAATQANDPAARALAEQNVQQDARLDEALGQRVTRAQQQRAARLDALNWVSRGYALAVEKQLKGQDDQFTAMLPSASNAVGVRSWAQMEASRDVWGADEEYGTATVLTIMLLIWVVLWTVWAFIFRGGLSFLMMGLSVVRRNGRPALRIQCAWRALVVWTPVAALALTALWLEAAYWSAWPDAGAQPWLLWASSAAWWASLALLPLYVALAVWRPKRSIHDWLAGTYVVPR